MRLDHATGADAAVIARFEDVDPTDPAGHRNLIALDEGLCGGRMAVEVIAEVEGENGPTCRLLRLTVDQAPFSSNRTGNWSLRPASSFCAAIDDRPPLSGEDTRGLVDLMLDFDSEAISLNLRTGVGDASQIRAEVLADDLHGNIRTGAHGGDSVIAVRDNDSADILTVGGTLRGTIGGAPMRTGSTISPPRVLVPAKVSIPRLARAPGDGGPVAVAGRRRDAVGRGARQPGRRHQPVDPRAPVDDL